MSKINHTKQRHRGKATLLAQEPKTEKAKAGWSHVKREPVRTFTAEERAAYMRGTTL